MGAEPGLRRVLRAVLAASLLVLAGAALGACARTSDGGSGETHFLMSCDGTCPGDLSCLCGVCTRPCDEQDACSSLGGSCMTASCAEVVMACDRECSVDAECADLGASHACVDGRCRGASTARPDAGSVADAGGRDAGGPHVADAASSPCPAGCTASPGIPLADDRGCVDTARPVPDIACNCGEPGPLACRQHVPDGTPWIVPQLNLEPAADWQQCSLQQLGASSSSCEFEHCEVPPTSLCSPDDLCALTDCGGFQFHGDGCRRRSCELDVDCDAGDRCLALECLFTGFCSYSTEGVCQCGGVTACISGRVCAPVEQVGQAGDWLSFTVQQGWGPCPADQTCSDTWILTPDGSLTFAGDAGSGTRVVDELSLAELRALIDGPELRPALAGALSCSSVPDYGVSMTLELSTGTLEAAVASCIMSRSGNVLERVFDLVGRL